MDSGLSTGRPCHFMSISGGNKVMSVGMCDILYELSRSSCTFVSSTKGFLETSAGISHTNSNVANYFETTELRNWREIYSIRKDSVVFGRSTYQKKYLISLNFSIVCCVKAVILFAPIPIADRKMVIF